jgi:uncharacterized protein YcfJ
MTGRNRTNPWAVGGAVALAGALPAAASALDGYTDRARVVAATPIYETVEVVVPRRECWTERVVERRPAGHGHGGEALFPTLIGGALGGYLGHKLGDGDAEAITTAMGTAIGLAVGHQVGQGRHIGRSYRPRVFHERRCETVEDVRTERRLTGYRVQYRYRGRLFETVTDHHPGDWIRVRVDVDPVDDHFLEDY